MTFWAPGSARSTRALLAAATAASAGRSTRHKRLHLGLKQRPQHAEQLTRRAGCCRCGLRSLRAGRCDGLLPCAAIDLRMQSRELLERLERLSDQACPPRLDQAEARRFERRASTPRLERGTDLGEVDVPHQPPDVLSLPRPGPTAHDGARRVDRIEQGLGEPERLELRIGEPDQLLPELLRGLRGALARALARRRIGRLSVLVGNCRTSLRAGNRYNSRTTRTIGTSPCRRKSTQRESPSSRAS
jgi:hypothetical protein